MGTIIGGQEALWQMAPSPTGLTRGGDLSPTSPSSFLRRSSHRVRRHVKESPELGVQEAWGRGQVKATGGSESSPPELTLFTIAANGGMSLSRDDAHGQGQLVTETVPGGPDTPFLLLGVPMHIGICFWACPNPLWK